MAEIVGFDELGKQLKNLGPAVSGKALRSEVGFALTPLKKEVERAVPKGTRAHKTYKGRLVAPGFASRNVFKTAKLDKRRGSVKGSVGFKGEAFYAAQFLELGTSTMSAQPTLRPAHRAKRAEMLDRMRSKLKQNIAKAVRK